MQVRYQIQAKPLTMFVAILVALAALVTVGALGYGLGRAIGGDQTIVAPRHAVTQLTLPGQPNEKSAFRYGPADRAGALSASQALGQDHSYGSFPQGLADRAGG